LATEYIPRRVVCLQPSATVTLADLGMLDRVVACTRWCADACPQVAQSGKAIVADSWTAKAGEILAAKPDLVIASVPYQQEALAEILKAGARLLALAPKSLEDIYADMAAIARLMGVPERGQKKIASMRREIEAVRLRTTGPRPRVFCEEWGRPIIASQLWVKELVGAAGGEFLFEPGKPTDAERVRRAEPDVIVMAWCGAADRVPLEKVVREREWSQLAAVHARRVYCVPDEYLNTPATTLVQGLRALAAAIHPEHFSEMPPRVRRIDPL